jgi:DNA-binding IclR family transcriptional regulator
MSTPSASTVLKAFEVLELFTRRRVLSASQAAELLGCPRSSAHRMLATLKTAGVLESSGGGRYQLTMRLFELGSSVPRRRELQDSAMQPLLELAGCTGLPVHLGVRDGQEVLFVERLSHHPSNLTRPGERGPLHATAAGKVLLAFSDGDFQESYLAKGLRRFTQYTCTDPDRLRSELATVRLMRLARGVQERRVGFISLARPVRDHGTEVVASVAVVVPFTSADRLHQLEARLTATCIDIEKRMKVLPAAGFRPTGVSRRDADGAAEDGRPLAV